MSNPLKSYHQNFNVNPFPTDVIRGNKPPQWKLWDWNRDRFLHLAEYVAHHNVCLQYISQNNSLDRQQTLEAIQKLPELVIEEIKKKMDPELVNKFAEDPVMQQAIRSLIHHHLKEIKLLQKDRIKGLEEKIEKMSSENTKEDERISSLEKRFNMLSNKLFDKRILESKL